MEELIGTIVVVILLIVLIFWLIGSGIEWVINNQSEIAQHIWAWKEFYIIIAFIAYLIIIRILTKKIFVEASHHKSEERKKTMLTVGGQFISRPIVFFLITILIWFRSQFFLTAVHYNEPDSLIPILLATTFGIIFAFWPTTTLRSIAYSIVLAHIRALYLIVAIIISITYISLAIVVSAVIILFPIGVYIALAFAVLQYMGGTINLRDTTHTILIVGGIAIFIMTARVTWNLSRYVINNYAHGIQKLGLNILESWKGFCQSLYSPISMIPLRLGAFLGGDAR